MANTTLIIKYDNPSLAGKVPAAADLQTGEPAFNLTDKRLFTKDLAGNVIEIGVPVAHVGAGGAVHASATTSANGFMSSTDKSKLDGIATGANLYT
ncbi:MAG: hypothetical protein ACR2HF_06430, partial [Methylococcaceae bacterium]